MHRLPPDAGQTNRRGCPSPQCVPSQVPENFLSDVSEYLPVPPMRNGWQRQYAAMADLRANANETPLSVRAVRKENLRPAASDATVERQARRHSQSASVNKGARVAEDRANRGALRPPESWVSLGPHRPGVYAPPTPLLLGFRDGKPMHRWRCCRRTKVPAIAFAKTKRSTVYRRSNGCVRPRPTPQVPAKADAPHEQSSPWPAPDRRRSETPWATRVRQTREAAQLPTRIWKQKKPGNDCPVRRNMQCKDDCSRPCF